MTAVNLLPKELKPKETLVKLSASLKKVGIIGFAVLIIVTLSFLGGMFAISRQLNTATERQTKLETTITAYEATEQKHVLVKDRLAKITQVSSIPNGSGQIENFDNLISILPPGTAVRLTQVSPTGILITIAVESSSVLVELLATLQSSGIFSGISLATLGYSDEGGYGVVLALN